MNYSGAGSGEVLLGLQGDPAVLEVSPISRGARARVVWGRGLSASSRKQRRRGSLRVEVRDGRHDALGVTRLEVLMDWQGEDLLGRFFCRREVSFLVAKEGEHGLLG